MDDVVALEHFKNTNLQFDIIFLDQMMPGMSGTQTLELIRQEHLADHTPIIALTADAIVGARDSYIKEGFTDYLSKPVMYNELEELLHKYLDKDQLVLEGQSGKEDRAADRNFCTGWYGFPVSMFQPFMM